MILIGISCITMALDEPTLDRETTLAKVLEYMDMALTLLFAIEMVMKLILKVCEELLGTQHNSYASYKRLDSCLARCMPWPVPARLL